MTYTRDIDKVDAKLDLFSTYVISNAEVKAIKSNLVFPDNRYKFFWTLKDTTQIQRVQPGEELNTERQLQLLPTKLPNIHKYVNTEQRIKLRKKKRKRKNPNKKEGEEETRAIAAQKPPLKSELRILICIRREKHLRTVMEACDGRLGTCDGRPGTVMEACDGRLGTCDGRPRTAMEGEDLRVAK
ncbi:unnamed protein product [Cuscuta europaea]|nr:unnamed protein product [Cuscuta europaea]